MGVNNLWFILEPAKRTENLSALRNKTLCVDLSGWICEAQCAKGLKNNVNKPHLRNLFFRLLHLTRLGVKLVFVVDGKPPELKWDAIAKRVQARDGGQFCKVKKPAKASAGSGARVDRSQFAIWVREVGVNNLWFILEPAKRTENLSALRNKTLCVDLSGWICEAQCAKGLKNNVNKPHLRNLFFRLLHLTRLGVKLVFVVDGKPPELKWDAIAKRVQARDGGQFCKVKKPAKASAGSGARVGRSQFAIWVRECQKLLNLLGVPCLESEGEAEALCAWLDLHQVVDGCITNDGDAFLYGARTVYRDLCISGKGGSVECYKMEEIEAKLDLNRQKLVALGILLGCDYLPQGVSGVGKEIAMKLIKSVNHKNLLDRFYEWTKVSDHDEILSSVEKLVKCKALKDENFPHPEVIQEFLSPKVVPQQVSLKIFNPDLRGLQEFCLKHLEWPEEYITEKVLLLITYWQMTSSLENHTMILVQPERIVKSRVQQRIECYEVEWKNLKLGETCPVSFVTIESRELFTQAYPEVVEEFHMNEAMKLSKKTKKKKATTSVSSSEYLENEVEFLSRQLEDISVGHSRQLQSSEPKNESCSSSLFGDVSTNDSLQDVIDSVLPTFNDYSLHPPRMKLSLVNSGHPDSDDDGYHDDSDDNDDNDDDDDEDDDIKECNVNIPGDPNSLQRELAPDNLDSEYGCGVDGSYGGISKSLMLRDVQATQCHLQVDVSIENHDMTDKKISNAKTNEYPRKRHEARTVEEVKSISESTTQNDFKSRNINEHGKKFMLVNNIKKSKQMTVLSEADVIEIFGSSDEDDDSESFLSRQVSSKFMEKTLKGSVSKIKSRNEIPGFVTESSEMKSLLGPGHYANSDFLGQTHQHNFPEEYSFRTNECVPDSLQEFLRDHSRAFLGKDDVKYVNDTKKSKKELLESKGQVLKPQNNGLISAPQSSNCKSKTAVKSNGFSDVYSAGRYEEVQGDKCGKENVDSPFDDFMPAPLSKRLAKQLRGKQRLASLHSISSVSDDK